VESCRELFRADERYSERIFEQNLAGCCNLFAAPTTWPGSFVKDS